MYGYQILQSVQKPVRKNSKCVFVIDVLIIGDIHA